MQIIEDILENDIIKCLNKIYNNDNDVHRTMIIFFLRCQIYYNKENIDIREYIDFLCNELNIPDEIFYDNIKVEKYIPVNNSLRNIMENLYFRYMDNYYNDIAKGNILGKDLVNVYFQNYSRISQSRLRYFKKKSKYYLPIYKYNMLEQLYEDFRIDNMNFAKIDKIKNSEIKIKFDEIYKNAKIQYDKNNNKLLEKELEDYIVKNGFENINILTRQMKIPSGIIDLLGEENNQKVLIELKAKSKPKDLQWQIINYKKDLEQIYNQKIKTVVIAPKLDESVLRIIPDYCEIYQYKKIKNKFKFYKIQREID